MISNNSHQRFSSPTYVRVPPSNRLAQRVRNYFSRHPEVSRAEFLHDAVAKELYFRTLLDRRRGPWFTPHALVKGGWFADLPALTQEDVRLHAWIENRLVQLKKERSGLWFRIRRLLWGN